MKVPVLSLSADFVHCKVSPADYKLAMTHAWKLDRDGYPTVHVYEPVAKRSTWLTLHRLVSRVPRGEICDHIFGNKLDCRRTALRIATPSQNSANRRASRRGRSSKYRGVTRHKTGKFQAQCKHGNVNHYLGLYAVEADAAAAYNKAARATWGKFAVCNRLPRRAAA